MLHYLYTFSDNCFYLFSIYILSSTVFLRLQDGVFSFQNNLKDIDPSCKTDLDLWDCLGMVKLVLLQNFIGLI